MLHEDYSYLVQEVCPLNLFFLELANIRSGIQAHYVSHMHGRDEQEHQSDA